jgi:hypothetical protein
VGLDRERAAGTYFAEPPALAPNGAELLGSAPSDLTGNSADQRIRPPSRPDHGPDGRRDGWTAARIRRLFVTRGLVLLVIQHFVENPAWILGLVSAAEGAGVAPPTGGDTGDVYLAFAVISALGFAMIFWGALIRLPSLGVAVVTAAAFAAGWAATPAAADVGVPVSVPMRLLLVMGQTSPVAVAYPFIPWLVPAGLGVLLGRAVLADLDRARRSLVCVGLAAITALVPPPFANSHSLFLIR